MGAFPEILYSFSISDIARICRVSLRTARRWKDGTRCPPATALMVLNADLGALDPKWSGWVLKRGLLCSPENWAVTPGAVRAMQIKEAQVSALEHQVLELKMELQDAICNGLEEQPLPEQWEVSTG